MLLLQQPGYLTVSPGVHSPFGPRSLPWRPSPPVTGSPQPHMRLHRISALLHDRSRLQFSVSPGNLLESPVLGSSPTWVQCWGAGRARRPGPAGDDFRSETHWVGQRMSLVPTPVLQGSSPWEGHRDLSVPLAGPTPWRAHSRGSRGAWHLEDALCPAGVGHSSGSPAWRRVIISERLV